MSVIAIPALTTADGGITSTSLTEVYEDAREGTGSASLGLDTDGVGGVRQVGQFRLGGVFTQVFQTFFAFDTSLIPAPASITAVELQIDDTVVHTFTDFTVEARIYDWGAAVTSADWRAGSALAALSLFASIAATAFTGSGVRIALTSDAGAIALLNRSGLTSIVLSSSQQRLDVGPGVDEDHYIDTRPCLTAVETRRPQLVVTYGALSGDPMLLGGARPWR